ncbi:MAG TPA: ATP-grasp domain-containing protein [Ktedonobacteraceae bacterium]|nr:ATP-grasp domain-containing protein [Ktedonobacteraceae bacterium]
MSSFLDGTLAAKIHLKRGNTIEPHANSPHNEPQTIKYDALILDARLRQSLVTVRSLGQRGKHVAALEVENLLERSKHVPTFTSRWCQQSYIAPSYEQGTEDYLLYLKQWLTNTGAHVLIPSSDGTLELLRKHRAEVEQLGTRVALAKEPGLAAATNKETTLEAAERLGLNIPRGVLVNSVSELAEAVREIGLPAVVKPTISWLWGGQQGARLVSKLVTTPDEARQVVETVSSFGGSTLLQQFLPGRREAMSFLYANGEIYARFAQWAKRTQPQLGGTSVYRQSIAIPYDIGEPAERLIHELDLEGYSEVEFRRDSAGKAYLMEINPRLSASVEIAVRAGVDFPYLLYQWANGECIDRIKDYQTGKWMRYLEGDLLTTIEAILQHGRPGITPPMQAIFEFLTTFFLPTGYDYLDSHDLRPAWTALEDFADRVWYRLRHNPHN